MSAARTPTQLRPLSAQHGILARADGSASFAFGTLSASAGATGPLDARIREELIDRAALQVHLTPLVGLPGIAARGAAQGLRELFESVVLLHLHPRSVLQLNVQLVTGPPIFVPPPRTSATSDAILIGEEEEEEDAEAEAEKQSAGAPTRTLRPSAPHPNSTFSVSQRATMINAAMLALLDNGIAMQATVAACACAYLPADHAHRLRKRRRRNAAANEAGEKESSVLVLDPTPEEEYYATSTHVFAFGFAGKPPRRASTSAAADSSYDVDDVPAADEDKGTMAVDQDADEEEEILYAESHGPADLERYTAAADLCRRAARGLIVPFYRRWLQQQHAKQ
ncbi:exosome non-catalytic core subunit rrp46 [Tilletia horrida]|nr:exosome non-catalytic core subunit rrp46 [Tilletia horrida]